MLLHSISGKMTAKDISWHLRYYEYSFLIYVGLCVVVVLAYVLIYCFKVPVNRVPNLESILEEDPVITESMVQKLGLAHARVGVENQKRLSLDTVGSLVVPRQFCIVSDPNTGALSHHIKGPLAAFSSSANGDEGGSRRPSKSWEPQNYWDPSTPEALGARFRFIGALNRQWRSPEAEAETLSALLEEH